MGDFKLAETALPFFTTMIAIGVGLGAYRLYQLRHHSVTVMLLSAFNEFNKYLKIGLLFLPILFFMDAKEAGLLDNRIIDPWTFIAVIFAFFTWFRGFYVTMTAAIQTAQYKAEREELEKTLGTQKEKEAEYP